LFRTGTKNYLNSGYLGYSYFHSERHESLEKMKRANKAVTEILGTILLLMIAVSFFAVSYYQMVNAPTPDPPPIVEISGKFFENQIILTHRGGESLDIDSEVLLTIGGKTEKKVISDYLDDDSKENGFWDFSEEFVYPVSYYFDYSEYPTIEVDVLDLNTNSLVFLGRGIGVHPVCDLGVEFTVDNLYPTEYSYVTFNITVTNYGNINASGAIVEFLLPKGLTYYSNSTTQGTYDNCSGIWDLGTILPGESILLTVKAQVEGFGSSESTQLVVVLDGSGSIKASNWDLCLEGLAASIEDGYNVPHNGVVELSVIQFGGKDPAYAVLEIGPIVIDETNVEDIVDDIRDISQIKDKTPTACAILLAADTLANSGIFTPDIRQIILLVTDGNPTHCCVSDGDYEDDQCSNESGPKKNAVSTRDYLLNLLEMTENQDEFDALAVEQSEGHANWLKDEIVWPEPGYYVPPFIPDPCRGWVRNVTSWEDFAYSINESFAIIFNRIFVSGKIEAIAFLDPKEVNDKVTVIIVPQ